MFELLKIEFFFLGPFVTFVVTNDESYNNKLRKLNSIPKKIGHPLQRNRELKLIGVTQFKAFGHRQSRSATENQNMLNLVGHNVAYCLRRGHQVWQKVDDQLQKAVRTKESSKVEVECLVYANIKKTMTKDE